MQTLASTDVELLTRFLESGDQSAFTELVRTHERLVIGTATRLTGDADAARDVAQQVFTMLARKGAQLRGRCSLAGWLHHTAWFVARNAQRSVRAWQQRHEQISVEVPESAAANEVWPVLEESLAALSDTDREAVVMHYLQDQSYADMAHMLGITEVSARKRVSRGIDNLGQQLRRRGFGGAAVMLLTAAASMELSAMTPGSCALLAAVGSASTTSFSGTLVSTLLAMKMQIALVVGAVLLVSAVGYDLGSTDSYLTKASAAAIAAPAVQTASKQATRTATRHDSIWQKKPSFDLATLRHITATWFSETDPAKQLALLRFIGIGISESAFARFMAEAKLHPGRFGASGATRDLLAVWAQEDPQAVLVWMSAMHTIDPSGGNRVSWMWAKAAQATIKRDPAAWEAFLKSCPDSAIATRAQLWLRELDQPGSIWAGAQEAGLTSIELMSSLSDRIRLGAPDETLLTLLACTDSMAKRQGMMGLAPRLLPEQLLHLASNEFANDEPISQMLRAMAGDATAAFDTAIARTLECRGAEFDRRPGLDTLGWAGECAERIYEQWVSIDPAAAIRRAASGKQEDLDFMMAEGLRQQRVNEPSVLAALAGMSEVMRDQALTALYHAQGSANPQATLQQIMASAYIQDEVRSAKPVLNKWASTSPNDAARWLMTLPAGPDRAELAAIIARRWVDQDLNAGANFAQQEGVGLDTMQGFYTAVTYATYAPPTAATAHLQRFQQQPQFNDLVIEVASQRFRTKPAMAIRFMADNAPSAWQQGLASNLVRWFKAHDTRGESLIRTINPAEFTHADPQTVATAGALYVKALTERKHIQPAFNWTLQLPAAAAAMTRAEGIARLDVSQEWARTTMTTWLQGAAISAEERAQLMQLLAERIRTRR